MSKRPSFAHVFSEGALLPYDLLRRISETDRSLRGLEAADYGLAEGERLNEAINRSWARLLPLWGRSKDALLQAARADTHAQPEARTAHAKQCVRSWLGPLLQELGFGVLAPTTELMIFEGRAFPISHRAMRSPVHLVGPDQALDTSAWYERPDGQGRYAMSPHGMVQDLLNRTDEMLWGIVSDGLCLRVLRDHHALTTQAYLEFDLQAIFDSGSFGEFSLLWLVAHATRFAPKPLDDGGVERPEGCWLERWFLTAREEGVRALDQLRDGVRSAIEALGQGFLRHPANKNLREQLAKGSLGTQDFYRRVLRTVYALVFVFVAEERSVLLLPEEKNHPERSIARLRYERWYALRGVRELSLRKRGGPHDDLWRRVRLVFRGLCEGNEALALPALGSFLFSSESVSWLDALRCSNEELLRAVHALSLVEDRGRQYPIDWRTVGADELGSVYEALLELHPVLERDAGAFSLRSAAGNERKTTGSYYTPTELVDCLLDSALDPVLDEAEKSAKPVDALLALQVCDPACGSGHFLLAAGRRIAKRIARLRAGEAEPGPKEVRRALRDVVSHCLYGVDVNPMAVELCKVSLWMEALEEGRALSFLDAHVQTGNSLLGATPALLSKGIPEEAFEELEGDDKEVLKALKKQHRDERKLAAKKQEQLGLSLGGAASAYNGAVLQQSAAQMEREKDETLADVERKRTAWESLVSSSEYQRSLFLANAWCAAFVWRKVKELREHAITESVWQQLLRDVTSASEPLRREVDRLAKEYGFFHWHLAFPQVFGAAKSTSEDPNDVCGWSGGFDVVLGNPPWERIRLEEKQFFAERVPEISAASSADKRRKMIAELKRSSPAIFAEFEAEKRRAEGQSALVRNTGAFPLCGTGDVNTYAVFAETARHLLGRRGQLGIIVPSGIATDDTTKAFFGDVISSRTLVSLFDFENHGLFAEVDSRFKFTLLTIGREARPKGSSALFVFFAHRARDIEDPDRRIELTEEDIARINPNTRTCPVFRTQRDARITKEIYRRTVILGGERDSSWGVEYLLKLVDPTIHSSMLETVETQKTSWGDFQASALLLLYEGKQIHQFDHRFASFVNSEECAEVEEARKASANTQLATRFRISRENFQNRLGERILQYRGVLSIRDITRPTDERTVIAAIRPPLPALNSVGNLFCPGASDALVLCGLLNSFAMDYVARQKLGGTHLSPFYLMQLPVIERAKCGEVFLGDTKRSNRDWLLPRVLELTYTAWDLEAFAKDCGYEGPPFRWDPERRFWLRAELDAAFFHLYGLSREDTAYVMDTFPIVRRKDEEKYNGVYRTKEAILSVYDALAECAKSGNEYVSKLVPPPADERVRHPETPRHKNVPASAGPKG